MKQFLVLLAVLPLMLVFFVQFTMDEVRSNRLAAVDDIVYAAKEEAKQRGCFTKAMRTTMQQQIAAVMSIDPSDVLIEATGEDDVKYRLFQAPEGGFEREMIYYKVSVPAGQLMAGRRLFGIKEEDNTYTYIIESYAASERLP